MSAIDDIDEHVPEPCTSEAVTCGCTCRMSWMDSATIDPPEPVIDRHCPLHGWGDSLADKAADEYFARLDEEF